MAELKEGAAKSAAPRRRRAQVRFKLRNLKPELREELDRRLREGRSGYRELSQWLEQEGAEISAAAIHHYYRNHFFPDLNAVRIACAETAAAIRESGGDDEAINRKLRSLVQETMFQVLVEMNQVREKAHEAWRSRRHSDSRRAATRARLGEDAASGDEAGAPTRAELVALSAFARAAVAFRKSDLDQSKWEVEKQRIGKQLAAAGEQVAEAARAGGLSAEAEERIRAALMEIQV